MAKLKKRVKKKWVEALRSGRYEQGAGALSRDGRYCCLGVLCEVAIDSGLPIQKAGDGWMVSYDEDTGILPVSVYEWATLKNSHKSADVAGDFRVGDHYLAIHNDRGESFSAIADLIEEHL